MSDITITLTFTQDEWNLIEGMRAAYDQACEELEQAHERESETGEYVDTELYYARDDQAVEIADWLLPRIVPSKES